MLVTTEDILKKYPDVLEFFKTPKRKYQVQEGLGLTRGETELITDVLLRENLITNTSLGWIRVKEE